MALRLSLAPDTITTQRLIHLHQDNPVKIEEICSRRDRILTETLLGGDSGDEGAHDLTQSGAFSCILSGFCKFVGAYSSSNHKRMAGCW